MEDIHIYIFLFTGFLKGRGFLSTLCGPFVKHTCASYVSSFYIKMIALMSCRFLGLPWWLPWLSGQCVAFMGAIHALFRRISVLDSSISTGTIDQSISLPSLGPALPGWCSQIHIQHRPGPDFKDHPLSYDRSPLTYDPHRMPKIILYPVIDALVL